MEQQLQQRQQSRDSLRLSLQHLFLLLMLLLSGQQQLLLLKAAT